jgi:hypothetical protein
VRRRESELEAADRLVSEPGISLFPDVRVEDQLDRCVSWISGIEKLEKFDEFAAGFKSEWWPASFRNGGRLQIGTPAGFMSEHPAGLTQLPFLLRDFSVAKVIQSGEHIEIAGATMVISLKFLK